MSSVHLQKGGPSFFCAFYDFRRQRCFRSTRVSDERVAKRICALFQELHDLASRGKYSATRFRRMVDEEVARCAEIGGGLVAPMVRRVLEREMASLARANGESGEGRTVANHLRAWVTAKRMEASPTSASKYDGIVAGVIRHLGPRAGLTLSALTVADVEGWRDALAARVAASTVNGQLKVLRTALNAAARLGVWPRFSSPAHHVPTLKRQATEGRRPFTMDELRRVLAAAGPDWRTAILFGLYTGQRLGDVAGLTWGKVDLADGSITLRARKTGRPVALPIAAPLRRHLEKLPGTRAADDPGTPIMPTLHGRRTSALSNSFHEVMSQAGLAKSRRVHKARGRGRGARRAVAPISFHSLRHTATTWLKQAGVSDVVARDIIGHDSTAVSRVYTALPESAKAEALAKLPDLTADLAA